MTSKIYKDKKQLVSCLIKRTDVVLDVGFWGQGVKSDNENWVHQLILDKAKETYGLDVYFDPTKLTNLSRYKKGSAEDFCFDNKFDVIFSSDLIEHLSNPGLFLQCCWKNLKEDGVLVLTTGNCFNIFSIVEKITKSEPTVNKEHTCYFNSRTLKTLLERNGWRVEEMDYIYSLGMKFKESIRKKILNVIYYILSKFTAKYVETLIVVAKKNITV